jgi:hypothetical protein
MSSSASKDRASLCLFTFTDGRRCRTPRSGAHPHFCFYHARKESQSQAAAKLAGDLSSFFSGDYLSACDLSTALGRLLVAVARGDIKTKTAATIASLARTLVQTIRLAQHEYINAFGTDGWRQAVCDSVNQNFEHLNPNSGGSDGTEETSGPEVPEDMEVPDGAAGDPAPSTIDETRQASTPAPQPDCVSTAQSTVPAPEPQRAEPVTSPTPAQEALTIARNPFPRRRDTTGTNPFKINIYNTPCNY